jgi:hypothetical protein
VTQSAECARSTSPAERPRLEVADIFRAYGNEFVKTHALSAAQRLAMRAITNCRTAALGGHVDVCQNCDHRVPAYNSCRNRHCPKCQALSQAKWIEERKERILPTNYFHVVFTLPSELSGLGRENPKALFDMLFEAAGRTLLELGHDPNRLGAELGITAVLHTWSRQLQFHPHVHCVVTGGGLDVQANRWISVKGRFLFPAKVLSRLFRGKFLALLSRRYDKAQLKLTGLCQELADPEAFTALKDRLYRKEWVVYAKRPFGGAEQVFNYLGRYTHRVGISNHRLRSMDDRGVTFATRDGATETVNATEFIRRFMLHVLPRGFVKIRHFGLMAAGNVNTKLGQARHVLESSDVDEECAEPSTLEEAKPDWREKLLELTGIDITLCPACKTGQMIRVSLGEPRCRAPPLEISPC